MSIIKSKEMFINMKNTPKYNQRKDYFEQSQEVLDFYEDERDKIINGTYIGGFFIHPWLYFHLNFFKTPIPVVKKTKERKVMTEEITNPPLDDNILYVIDSYKEAEDTNKGLCLFGSRGFSKSTILTSLTAWLTTTKSNGTTSITGGSEPDLKAISRLMETSFTKIHPAFFIPRLVSNWNEEIQFGVKEKNNQKLIHSYISITNANKGSKKNTEKGAGLSPVGAIYDEIGKYNVKGILDAALPSFNTQHGAKLVHVLAGTGGNEELSKDAKKILSDPEASKLIMMNWDRLDKSVPEEAITWERSKKTKFSIFVPGQMSYRLDVPKITKPLSEHLGVSNRDLKRISIKVTDWRAASSKIQHDNESLKKEEDRNKNQMYFPLEVADIFLTLSANPFPVTIIEKRIRELEDLGKTGIDIGIYRDGKDYKYEFVKKRRAEVSHGGGVVDAPIILYNEFPKGDTPPRNLYVSGLDGYKLDESETDSLGAMYLIKRRNQAPNEPCEKIMCSYASRPERMREFHRNCELMSDVWNAECLMEGLDLGFKQYLEAKGRHYDVLHEALSLSNTSQKRGGKLRSGFGLYPTKGNKEQRFNLLVDYCKEEHVVEIEEDGTPVYKLGVEFIDDIDLLKEMRDWQHGDNVDRIDAFSHALVLARELDKKEIQPVKLTSRKEAYSRKEQEKRARMLKNNRYGTTAGNKYGQSRGRRY